MNSPTPAQPVKSADPGDKRKSPAVLLMGDVNTAKTSSIRTIVDMGFEVFYLATEPGYEDILGDIPPDKLHWNYVAPVQDDMNVTMDKVKLVMSYTDKQLKEMGGVNKARHTQYLDVMKLCNNFVDARTRKEYGDVADLKPDTQCLVLDGLSGLSIMATKVKIGDKPFMEQNDYYAVQQMLRDFINTLVTGTQCLFVMTAHIEYEPDPIQGGQRIMASTVGQKLAPEIPRYFSDVVICKKAAVKDAQGNWKVQFTWDNVDPMAKVKARNLPFSDKHPANFKPLIENWRKRQAAGQP